MQVVFFITLLTAFHFPHLVKMGQTSSLLCALGEGLMYLWICLSSLLRCKLSGIMTQSPEYLQV